MTKKNTNNNTKIYINKKIAGHAKSSQNDACLIVIKGKDENKKYDLFLEELNPNETKKINNTFKIGREHESNNIVLMDDTASRQHAQIIQKGNKFYIKDSKSTNGTYLNGEKLKTETILKNQDRISIGDTTMKFLQGDTESLFLDNLRKKIYYDELTGAYNKHYFVEHFSNSFALAKRHNKKLSLIIFDVDDFKKINDTYGHPAGDFVLSKLGEIIGVRVRKTDIFSRVGGEEFAILCMETNLKNCKRFAEKLCELVDSQKYDYDRKKIPVTISCGVCEYKKWMQFDEEMYKCCDSLLYKAKNSGKNRVVADN